MVSAAEFGVDVGWAENAAKSQVPVIVSGQCDTQVRNAICHGLLQGCRPSKPFIFIYLAGLSWVAEGCLPAAWATMEGCLAG
jgi:hypothetical protein